MPTIEFEGKTTEEAIEKACSQLHISSDQLKFEILSTGSSGIFGLGGKKASIRVSVEEKISTKNREQENEKEDIIPERTENRNFRDRSDRNDRRERSDRGERKTYPKKEQIRPERTFKQESQYQESPKNEQIPSAPTVTGPGETEYDGPEDDVMSKGREVLEEILNKMSIEAEVKVNKIEDRIILTVEGENSGLLIGKKGATLDAIQFVVNKIVNKDRDEKFRMIVDTENYRVRRHQSLIQLANRMADKARRTRRPITISQLSAHDRRVVHLALQDKNDLKTRSRGEGPVKNIVIVPGSKKAGGRQYMGKSNRQKPSGRTRFDGDGEDVKLDI